MAIDGASKSPLLEGGPYTGGDLERACRNASLRDLRSHWKAVLTDAVFEGVNAGDFARTLNVIDDRLAGRRTHRPTGQPAMPKVEGGRCVIPGCHESLFGRELCSKHYYRWYRAGKPDIEQYIAAGGPKPRRWRAVQALEGATP